MNLNSQVLRLAFYDFVKVGPVLRHNLAAPIKLNSRPRNLQTFKRRLMAGKGR